MENNKFLKKVSYQGESQNQDYKREPIDTFYKSLNFQSYWITKGADEQLILFAEKTGKYMAPLYKGDRDALSNSQIRNVFGEIRRIQFSGFDKNKASFYLLKPKVAYAEGRNNTKGMQLFRKVFDESWQYIQNQNDYLNFCNLLEAILAYHKANEWKD
ncbi:type III-A CRISPR-associated protein Csm2 [Parabacteroides sp. Marseille-P3160]|uniref:type III-A CRISPR-associated protein Csm2 n=1 Tax=Parabacteroides sp. Marseille-P3160 TaxID=1917887 RepID=UPI0009BB18AE|nr:type III-A CRISPR-associated protein Csm2 [Parabacteroides sp. Marseille-P3160]